MEGEPKAMSSADELKQSFDAAVTRAGRFLVTTVALLSILVIIVELQLHEDRRNHTSLENQKRIAQKELRPKWRELTRRRSDIGKLLGDLRKGGEGCKNEKKEDVYPIPPFFTPTLSATATEARGNVAMPVPTAQRAMVQVEPSRPTQPTPAGGQSGEDGYPYEFLCNELERARAPISAATDHARLEQLKARQSGLREVENRLEADTRSTEKTDTTLIGRLHTAVQKLGAYDEALDKYSLSAQDEGTASDELKKLDSERPSIPTPFGDFKVQPALALMGLTVAALLCYVAFVSTIWKIGSYAKARIAKGRGDDAPGALDAPLWVFGNDPDLQGALKWPGGRRLAALTSVGLHAVWLSVGALLVRECLVEWQSTRLMLFGYGAAWQLLLVGCFALAAGVFVWNFLPYDTRSRLAARSGGVSNRVGAAVSRRSFLIASLVAVAVATVVGAPYLRPRRRRRRQHGLEAYPFVKEFNSEPWVIHVQTLIVHHADACSKHLPSKKNGVGYRDRKSAEDDPPRIQPHSAAGMWTHSAESAEAILSAVKAQYEKRHPTKTAVFYLHRDCQVNILEHLARNVIKGLQPYCKLGQNERRDAKEKVERAAGYLSTAVGLNPYNYRLYDKLVGLYGYLCEYERIYALLNDAKQKIDDELAALPRESHGSKGAMERRRLDRAHAEFQSRVDSAARRAKKGRG